MLYAGLALALIAVLLLLFIRSIWRHNRVVGKRPQELQQLRASLGLEPLAVEDPEDNTLDRQLLRGSTLARTVEGMDGGLGDCVQGELGGFTVLLGDFFHTVAGGRMPSTMHTVLVVTARHGGPPTMTSVCHHIGWQFAPLEERAPAVTSEVTARLPREPAKAPGPALPGLPAHTGMLDGGELSRDSDTGTTQRMCLSRWSWQYADCADLGALQHPPGEIG